jgi:hypothetical protein
MAMNFTFPLRTVSCAAGALLLAAALAGCQTDSNGMPVASAAAPAVAAAPKPLTHQQAALDCWMATEHGHKDLPLDKRADIVDQCIRDKMAGKPVPKAAAAADRKPASPAKPKT